MSTVTTKYLIVGGGNSAGYAAKAFIEAGGKPGELAILTDEPVVSYERPALSKAYLFPDSPARLPGFHTCVGVGGERQGPEWYREHGIDFKTSTRVTAVDTKSKIVVTDHGSFEYQKMIIATGARPTTLADFKTPGADLQNIFYLRDVRDADKIVGAVATAKKVVCVGGGYIGMETAAAMAMNGLEVTMVFPEKWMFARLLTEKMASFYENFYESKGIKIVKGALATAMEGENGAVSSVVLNDGTKLECDMVIVGIGARPNTELFKGQVDLLETAPGGVIVDSRLRTSDPDVYAVGDIAAFPQSLEGGHLTRQEHVVHARLSAAFAIRDAMGLHTDVDSYEYLPFFYSRVFTLSWQFYGQTPSSAVVKEFGDHGANKFGAFWVDGGAIVGGFFEGGSAEEFSKLKDLVVARKMITENGLDM